MDTARGTARPPRPGPAGVRGMGYQPTLDGIRAIAVVAVILYHADLRWLPGGFLGVDVFFVVSGYLITSLLVEERRGSMTTDLKRFWLRRAKRLLPALFAMLTVTCVYAALAVPDALYRLRTDVLAAATYSTNWWLIASKQSYFEALGRPPLLRHLWSLAVEEQWYLLWPLVFVVGMSLVRGRTHRLVVPLLLAALASTVWMAIVFDPSGDASRAYFGTDTRAAGLLLGAAAAMVWTPWRWPWAGRRRLPGLDALGWIALLALVSLMLQWGEATTALYRGGFLLVSLLSLAVVTISVHPGATTLRAALSLAPLRWLGSRSYGLYLWHWPVFMVTRQQDYPGMDSRLRFLLRLAITFVLTELSFRLVERPVRDGTAMQWIADGRAAWSRRARARQWAAVGATAALVTVVFVGARVATAEPVDIATGGAQEEFQPETPALSPIAPVAAAGVVPPTVAPVGTVPGATGPSGGPAAGASSAVGGSGASGGSGAAGTLPAHLPRRVVVVGDSQASALVKNAPRGLGRTLALTNGAVEGCGLVDHGTLRTTADFRRSFGNCKGWPAQWAASARRSKAEIALVVIGAWDVFDVAQDSGVLSFGSPAHDGYLLDQLQRGVDGLVAAGAHVALLEVPCYDPVDGGGLTALPERGDQRRTDHLNHLLRLTANNDPAHVTFVRGPRAWCEDHSIATDLTYRWDGVHYYRPGAKLVFDTIAPTLATLP